MQVNLESLDLLNSWSLCLSSSEQVQFKNEKDVADYYLQLLREQILYEVSRKCCSDHPRICSRKQRYLDSTRRLDKV